MMWFFLEIIVWRLTLCSCPVQQSSQQGLIDALARQPLPGNFRNVEGGQCFTATIGAMSVPISSATASANKSLRTGKKICQLWFISDSLARLLLEIFPPRTHLDLGTPRSQVKTPLELPETTLSVTSACHRN